MPLTCKSLPVTKAGTPGNDTVNGTNDKDVISGGGGNDTINGKDGADVLCGESGNDTFNGGAGATAATAARAATIKQPEQKPGIP